ncbi:peptidoglycan-associated lipoprotein [Rhodothalassium salexigens DSM 2132]|uniref:Peptidoglycan-associated lipoprotein n=1 Tax=Rhodothalassium salexigens DSM 2132 TaxID=1188247 RepID=A0A4R2PQ31_RHOSA|nr:peptidoglycan-associated lipoprotein Pal [Rhodothalassium salexigens]MBB4210667.1 peptidoglycan-associated lipoprotein [Rhodothalassium salexigens DSM 2132]TCP37777.1 peptidoglycan-associated lipoprotein [Rhodothalassium salexigens DSM 2132]
MPVSTKGLRHGLTLFAIVLVSACARDAAQEEGPDVTAPAPEMTDAADGPGAVGRGGVDGTRLDGADDRYGAASYSSFKDFVGADRVYFDFDESNIRVDARPILDEMAEWLKHHDDVTFTIEGHADRRGTREYNLALGERRAQSVEDYLVAQGVSSDRIDTISYGKERLVASGTSQRAHQLNRRARVVFNN